MTLADRALRRLACDRERFDQEIVEVLAVVEPLTELGGLGGEGVVRQPFHLRFEGVDVRHEACQCSNLLALAGPEDTIENSHGVPKPTEPPHRGTSVLDAPTFALPERRHAWRTGRPLLGGAIPPSPVSEAGGWPPPLSGCREAFRARRRRLLPSGSGGAASRGCCG